MRVLEPGLSQTCDVHMSSSHKGRFFPRRAVMYVPASDERKIRKIPSLNVDTVVLDFEDGVASNQKSTARKNIQMGLSVAQQSSSECVVRINGVTSELLSLDLTAVFMNSTNNQLDALMLPKCENIEHLKQLDFAVGFHRGDPHCKPLPLHVIVESPSSLKSLHDICQCGVNVLRHLKLETVIFGSDDFLATIGGQRTESSSELIYARQYFVTTVKEFGLQAIDLVSIDYKNLDALRIQALEGSRMGFTGKQIIHPGQIPIVQDSFSPSPELTEWARGLITAFHQYEESGKGAFTYQDKMIDRPLLLQAQNIVNMYKTLHHK